MQLVEVRVERDERLAIPTSVAPWEVPILQTVHGPEKIIEVRKHFDGRGYPDPSIEFDRLVRRYGQHVESETPWAVKVYGEPPRSIRELSAAMAEARVEEKALRQEEREKRAAAARASIGDI